MKSRLLKYNPAFLSEQELIESFVVRKADLEMIMRIVRDNEGSSNQHIMVIGQRGMGKTTLVLRTVAELKRDETLNGKWYPLVFGEESYEVASPGEFWLEALFHLGEQSDDARLKQTYEELKLERSEERLRERALGQLLDFADSQSKRIMLVVENFDSLLGRQLTADEAWVLRHALVNEPRIMLLATALSNWGASKDGFDEIQSADKAMYELFKPIILPRLKEKECVLIWDSITGRPPPDRRARPIQILTGGNPRLIAIISSFGAKLSFKGLMDDLMQLVDDNTEYFRSHLENIAATERKVYLALAEAWDPRTARDVANAARLDVNKASSLLNRLVNRGAVVVVHSEGRSKWYQVAERMYNVYYIMRRRGVPSARVKAVVTFIVNFYRTGKVFDISRVIAKEAATLESTFNEEHYLALGSIYESLKSSSLREQLLSSLPGEFLRERDVSVSFTIRYVLGEDRDWDTKRSGQTANRVRESPSRQGNETWADITKENRELIRLIQMADRLSKNPNTAEEAKDAFEQAILLNPKNEVLYLKFGMLLHDRLKRFGDAEIAYKRATEINPNLAGAWVLLALLYDRGMKKYEEAEVAYRKALTLDCANPCLWTHLGRLLHHHSDRHSEAEEAYRTAIRCDSKNANAWFMLGELLHDELERYEEAEKAYHVATKLEPSSPAPWGSLGNLLYGKLNRFVEAEEAYRKAVKLDPTQAWIWNQLGRLLYRKLEKFDEAEEALWEATRLEPDTAAFWCDLASILRDPLEQFQKSEDIYRKALELDPNDEGALFGLAILFHLNLQRYKDSESIYRRLVELKPETSGYWAFFGLLMNDNLDKHEEASKAFLKAVNLAPNHRKIWSIVLSSAPFGTSSFERLLEFVRNYRKDHDWNTSIGNDIAYTLYLRKDPSNLGDAEEWAREALAADTEDPSYQHTLASILAAQGKSAEALHLAEKCLRDPKAVNDWTDEAIDLFVTLGAISCRREAVKILDNSASREILEPLLVGLKLYLGEAVITAAEILEIGEDVRQRIVERGEELRPISQSRN